MKKCTTMNVTKTVNQSNKQESRSVGTHNIKKSRLENRSMRMHVTAVTVIVTVVTVIIKQQDKSN